MLALVIPIASFSCIITHRYACLRLLKMELELMYLKEKKKSIASESGMYISGKTCEGNLKNHSAELK